jgi:hypothetical protein
MIGLQCPQCEHEFSVKSSLVGKVVRCPGCDRKIRVPDDGGDGGLEPAPRRKKRKKPASSTKPRIILGVVAGLVILGLVVLLLVSPFVLRLFMVGFFLLGLLSCIVGTLGILGIASRESPIEYWACLLIPFYDYIFARQRWEQAWVPCLLAEGGRVCIILGLVLGYVDYARVEAERMAQAEAQAKQAATPPVLSLGQQLFNRLDKVEVREWLRQGNTFKRPDTAAGVEELYKARVGPIWVVPHEGQLYFLVYGRLSNLDSVNDYLKKRGRPTIHTIHGEFIPFPAE